MVLQEPSAVFVIGEEILSVFDSSSVFDGASQNTWKIHILIGTLEHVKC